MVITLAVLAGLILIVGSIAASQRVAFRAELNRMEARRARIAAEAGIQRALAEFLNQPEELTAVGDVWETLGSYGSERFVLNDVSFRLQILDASGLVDLNSAPEEQLQRLPLTSEQIDSLLDWRSEEREPRPEGAKDEYYNNLPRPYNTKLGPLDSVEELLLVKGFTPAALYSRQDNIVSTATLVQGGEDEQPLLVDLVTVGAQSRNVDLNGLPKLNANQVTIGQMTQRGIPPNVAAAIFQRRGTFTGLGQLLQVPGVNAQNAAAIVDNLAVNAEPVALGRVNVNTASEGVLNTLPEMAPDVALAIVQRQTTPFNSVGELFTLPGFTLELGQQVIDRLTVNSQTFLVRVIGRAGDTEVALEASVVLEEGVPRVTSVREASFGDMWRRWGWDQEPTHDIVLFDQQ
ncbi:MAG TPA: type II secretion system protein GspK [Fimbriimonadaceae bacterium]|nr:type II secretion system protein GspK [Fimbriimonadaceae bacterium]